MVAFDYTLTDESGTVIDSSKGKEPMHYVHGKGQIIPGLEKELAGMPVGGEKKVTVKPEDGYGPVNLQAFQEIPKDKLPPDALKVGTVLTATGPQGQSVPVRVHEVKENTCSPTRRSSGCRRPTGSRRPVQRRPTSALWCTGWSEDAGRTDDERTLNDMPRDPRGKQWSLSTWS